jgi:hypothetical protein
MFQKEVSQVCIHHTHHLILLFVLYLQLVSRQILQTLIPTNMATLRLQHLRQRGIEFGTSQTLENVRTPWLHICPLSTLAHDVRNGVSLEAEQRTQRGETEQ